jgi:endonuclease III related protein
MSSATKPQLEEIFQICYAKFGPQHWWPGETPFEVMVGAILTQNTNWGNVEKAIANLKRAGCLTPLRLKTISQKKLASLIRPSGYYNIKAKRLKNFINFLFQEFDGDLRQMKRVPLSELREKILAVKGIGPETADSILLYACQKPIFVTDAYTRRVLSRHGFVASDADYHSVQKLFMTQLEHDPKLFNEFHALFVALGKNFCKPTPRCLDCPLNHKSLPRKRF